MNTGEVVLTIALGLAVNELWDVSPWLAAKIIPVAARLWTRDPERREIYAEAWQAIVDERPGKLFKLGTALGFLLAGVARTADGRTRAAVRAHLAAAAARLLAEDADGPALRPADAAAAAGVFSTACFVTMPLSALSFVIMNGATFASVAMLSSCVVASLSYFLTLKRRSRLVGKFAQSQDELRTELDRNATSVDSSLPEDGHGVMQQL